jgi:glycosyltransferase involved in cell wall biosynthesis
MIREEKKQYDVVVLSFLERSNVVNLLSSAFTGHLAVLSIRINLSIQYKVYPLVRWFFKRFYKKAYAITSNSAGVCGQMIEEYQVPKEKVFHIPNCYDAENILRLASERMNRDELEQLIQKRNYFVSINRLDHQKKIGFQIELIAELKKIFPGICLIVVGDGPQRNALLQQSSEAGLSVYDHWGSSSNDLMQTADIIFLGHTNNPYRLCSFSKALLLTSEYESLPNVVIEALICKTVVIAADCYFGPREILSEASNYTDPNRKYGKMGCGILLPLIDSTEVSMPIWLDHARKVLQGDITFNDFESATAEKIQQYQLPTVVSKWESLLH